MGRFHCAGQIELYSHIPVLRTFVDQLKRWDFNVCAVYMLDAQVSTPASVHLYVVFITYQGHYHLLKSMFSSDSDKNGCINFWMFSGGSCASWPMARSLELVSKEQALTASWPLWFCSSFQMWPSTSVGVWLLCQQWSNWSSLILMCWPKLIFYLTSETLTGKVPSIVKALDSPCGIVYSQLLTWNGDEWQVSRSRCEASFGGS